MTPERQKLYDKFYEEINNKDFCNKWWTEACYYGNSPNALKSNVCHYSLGDSLTTETYKTNPLVNNVFHSGNEYAADLLSILKETLYNPLYSLFKDILPFITLVENKVDPRYSVFFYLNDSGRNLTNFERAQVMSFFLFSRIFTEHNHHNHNFIKLWNSGIFTFEECSIFQYFLEKAYRLPRYDTHWAFNGPSIGHCYNWLFRIGPKDTKNHTESGLYVNDKLWCKNKAVKLFFDGSGKVTGDWEYGSLGRYNLNQKLTYSPMSEVGLEQSLRSFLDNYRKEYVNG